MSALNEIYTKIISKYKIFVLLAIITAAVFVRVSFINADPPENLSFSAALYTDEGFKVYEARNLELFGDWRWTDRDEYPGWKNQSPLSVYTYAGAFKVLGVNFFSIRIVSILYSIFTLLLLYFFVKRNYDRDIAILSSAIYAVNFLLAMYNRLGFYETHLNFYFMAALFAFTEASGIVRTKISLYKRALNRELLYRIIFFITGIAALIAAYFIKKSSVLAAIAVVPALVIIISGKYFKCDSKTCLKLFTIMAVVLALFYIVTAHFNYIEFLFPGNYISRSGLARVINMISRSFDPVHLMMGKALFVEAVFLQPVTFFTGIIFAVYSFKNVSGSDKKNAVDLILSSWFVFGFIMLTLLQYHPSRYYMLISIPLVILCSRALYSIGNNNLKSFILKRQGFPFGVLKILIAALASAYVIVSLFFHIIPFRTKKDILHWIYREAEAGFPDFRVIIVVVIMFILISAFVYLLFKKKYLAKIINYRSFANLLLVLIFSIQFFQYGKWFLFHENKLESASLELNRETEPDSVVAGSWSAGLVIESRNPALILQKDLTYNAKLLDDLIIGKEIPVTLRSKTGVVSSCSKNFPLYFAVSPGTIFERKIYRKYEKYLKKENLFKTIEFGYFDVNIYKITNGGK